MDSNSRSKLPKLKVDDAECILPAMSLLDNPADVVRASAVCHFWQQYVIKHGLCKKLFTKRFPRVTHVAYEVHGRYHIIRLSDVLTGDADEWEALEREHRIYSYLLHPRSKQMDCPRDCLLFPVDASSIAEILTSRTPDCTYPVGFSFLSSEGKSEITEVGIDFLKYLESDTVVSILSLIENPADIVRIGAVSHFWRRFVTANGLAKQLCLKVLPQLSTIAGVVVGRWGTSADASTSRRSEIFERDHTVYAALLHAFNTSKVFRKDCIEYAVSASSTDNFPTRSISNTLLPLDRFNVRPAYWSSTGNSNLEVPETLIYKLRSGFWLITEIDMQPLKVFFQHHRPVYSARFVRFRIGHPKSASEISNDPKCFPLPDGVDDKFEWTYTSPEFPMAQDDELQRFRLPEPVLCLDRYVQVELLGRVQKHESSGLFYICMNHVRVVGRALFPAFETEVEEGSGKMWIKYYPQFFGSIMKCISENDVDEENLGNDMDLAEERLPFLLRDPLHNHFPFPDLIMRFLL